jgi:hypothetical protein
VSLLGLIARSSAGSPLLFAARWLDRTSRGRRNHHPSPAFSRADYLCEHALHQLALIASQVRRWHVKAARHQVPVTSRPSASQSWTALPQHLNTSPRQPITLFYRRVRLSTMPIHAPSRREKGHFTVHPVVMCHSGPSIPRDLRLLHASLRWALYLNKKPLRVSASTIAVLAECLHVHVPLTAQTAHSRSRRKRRTHFHVHGANGAPTFNKKPLRVSASTIAVLAECLHVHVPFTAQTAHPPSRRKRRTHVHGANGALTFTAP